MRCDLHTHSNHSDGTYSPRELIAEAKEKGIIIALTDHNSVSGLPEFMAEAQAQGVTAVGGVELSTEQDGREFHLLGLLIEPQYYGRVEELCLDFHRRKRESNIALVKRLNEAGYKLDFSDVEAMNVKGRVNRAHIAHSLVSLGYVSSISEAFDLLLDEDRGYYIPPHRLSLTDGIKFLRGIGAVPILAHPLKEISHIQLDNMLPKLLSAGLAGIETMHSSYDEEMIKISKQLAAKHNLLESGGSDFHGAIRPGVKLGEGKGNLNIGDDIYTALVKWKTKNQK